MLFADQRFRRLMVPRKGLRRVAAKLLKTKNRWVAQRLVCSTVCSTAARGDVNGTLKLAVAVLRAKPDTPRERMGEEQAILSLLGALTVIFSGKRGSGSTAIKLVIAVHLGGKRWRGKQQSSTWAA